LSPYPVPGVLAAVQPVLATGVEKGTGTKKGCMDQGNWNVFFHKQKFVAKRFQLFSVFDKIYDLFNHPKIKEIVYV
jgi:hypothetical protein